MQAVDVDLASKKVKVQYDGGKVSADTLKDAIVEAGYDVKF